VRRLGAALAGLLVLAACGSSEADRASSSSSTSTSTTLATLDRYVERARIPAEEPAAMALDRDGSLLIGERRSGRILRVGSEQLDTARPTSEPVARVDVATEGQQGLLGLAVTPDGSLLAGMTRPGPGPARQVVVRVVPDGEPEPVWIGPVAADEAIGGRLAVTPEGRVLIGLGDFLRGPAGEFEPDEPYSKLLSLDPAGPPDQEPVVVSEGWYNPFAFAVAPDGAVWVADNAPGDTPERIGRGDGGPVREMDRERAPSGLAVLGEDELAVCGFVSGVLELVPIVDGEVREPTELLADRCRLGVLPLGDGALAVALDDAVQVLELRNP
jgi:glucose/arabinose dehydrogenase